MIILFVCTGNTCRSPMAAALWAAAHPGDTVRSAGLAPGGRVPALAVAAVAEWEAGGGTNGEAGRRQNAGTRPAAPAGNRVAGGGVADDCIAGTAGAAAAPTLPLGTATARISAHIPQPVTDELLREADVVVAMTDGHRAALVARGVPKGKIAVWDIPDPFGGDTDSYRAVRDAMLEKMAPEDADCTVDDRIVDDRIVDAPYLTNPHIPSILMDNPKS
ncbi:MAG: hypothetical protein FWF49_02385 [Oscillospiraceae bacterium]|nr:hypothetical protein [Oscillospiraceae bacterium]